MKNFEMLIKECETRLDALQIPYHKATFVVDNRAVRRWGLCSVKNGKYTIKISKVLLEDFNPDDAVKNTIIHELLHTVDGCMNHGEKWKMYANKVNKAYGYNVKRCSDAEEKCVIDNRNNNRTTYEIRCEKCGHVYVHYRRCKVMSNINSYRCGICKGKLIAVNF